MTDAVIRRTDSPAPAQAAPAGPFRSAGSAGAMRRSGASASTACWRSARRVHAGRSWRSPWWRRATAPSGRPTSRSTSTSPPTKVDPAGTRAAESLSTGDYQAVVRECPARPVPGSRQRAPIAARSTTSSAMPPATTCKRMVMENPTLIGTTQRVDVLASDDIDMLAKGRISRDGGGSRPADQRPGRSPGSTRWRPTAASPARFNANFFTTGDSREPEQAGLGGAMVGTVPHHRHWRSCCRCRSASRRRSISRSSRPRTAGPT